MTAGNQQAYAAAMMNNLLRASALAGALLLTPGAAGLALAVDQTPPRQPSPSEWQQRLLTNAVMGAGVLRSDEGEESLFQLVAGPTGDPTGHNRNGNFIWAERGGGDAYTGGIQAYTIQNSVATISGSGPFIEPDGSRHGVQFSLTVTPTSMNVSFTGNGYNEQYRETLTAGFIDIGVGSVDTTTLRQQMDGAKPYANELRQRMDALKQLAGQPSAAARPPAR